MSTFAPSEVNEGYVDHANCPLMFGKGFGPHKYYEMFCLWEKLSELKTEDPAKIRFVTDLLSSMSAFARKKNVLCEGVLSGVIAGKIQQQASLFQSPDNRLAAVHQVYMPIEGSSPYVDIAVMDLSCDKLPAHALIEIKWESSPSEFPEVQASAYPVLLEMGNWAPVLALSTNHFRIGIAFLVPWSNRWVYSEIAAYHCSGSVFDPANLDDVNQLMNFCEFLWAAAAEHKIYPNDPLGLGLVDHTGAAIPLQKIQVISGRVFKGTGKDGAFKFLKFYESLEAAESAVIAQSEVAAVTGNNVDPGALTLFKGCGADKQQQALCAVLADSIETTTTVSYRHLLDLTNCVRSMSAIGFVHGDLRVPNILFKEDQTVTLIDFEWSGREKYFPLNVNLEAYFFYARPYVGAGRIIHANFDWICLADIFQMIECPGAVVAALSADYTGIVAELEEHRRTVNRSSFRIELLKPRTPCAFPDFSLLDERIKLFYRKSKTKTSKKRPASSGDSF